MSPDTSDPESKIQKLLKENRILQKKLKRSEINRTHLGEVNEKNQNFLAKTLVELEEANETIKTQHKRMERELSVGHEIQMSMLPLIFPAFPNRTEFTIYAKLIPAREVGGDFYDFYLLDDEHICFCVADVSEKGVPAALFMAVAKTLIKSRSFDDSSPASIITHVNDEMASDNPSCMFVTLFIGILNIKTGEMTFTNAGHNPPFVVRSGGQVERLGQRHGPVVGAVEGVVYEESELDLAPGDYLFMYTDGITEAMDPEKNLYSEDRLVCYLEALGEDGIEDVVGGIITEVEKFGETTEQADDQTVLAVQYNGLENIPREHLLKFTMVNEIPEIAVAINRFNDFAEENQLPEQVQQQMNMVLDELLSNTISYAFQNDEKHEIELRIEKAEGRLLITINDDGIPFNPLKAEAPDTGLSMDDREPGGLGILLVRNMVDDIEYKRRIDGNQITLVKRLDSDDSA